MDKLQPILVDSSDFTEIRENKCIYVDKTAYFHQLITRRDARRFFLARPRRFGKSLMISTLKAIFEGRRELFDGLAISNTDYEWKKYPVLHFNFGFAAMSSGDEFRRTFSNTVKMGIQNAGGTYDSSETAIVNFGNAIDVLSTENNEKGVVILIDEYDDPVARLLDKPEEAEKVRGMLASFYGQMKDRTGKIRFLMITGVSKFTKMSVFSALSNLVDLSFDDDYATMLGYTEAELDEYFAEHMRDHAKALEMDYDAYRAELKRWFNGYRFWKFKGEAIYNPVSIGMNLSKREPEFKPYWRTTGKASMLMNYIKRDGFLSIDMESVRGVQEDDFDVSDIRNLKPVPMLFQTGYLTIGDYNRRSHLYELRVPNEEVRKDLAILTAAAIADRKPDWVTSLGSKLLLAEWDEFFEGLKALYAALPYGSKEGTVHEFSYERCLYVLLKSQAIRCTTEDRQANGQADIVADSPAGVFIFELKVNESADEALRQVREKHYDAPYHGRGIPIWTIGLNFDGNTRQLVEAKVLRS